MSIALTLRVGFVRIAGCSLIGAAAGLQFPPLEVFAQRSAQPHLAPRIFSVAIRIRFVAHGVPRLACPGMPGLIRQPQWNDDRNIYAGALAATDGCRPARRRLSLSACLVRLRVFRPCGKDRPTLRAFIQADSRIGACCRSSVVEHSIGNGEVDSSILSGSTIFLGKAKRTCKNRPGFPTEREKDFPREPPRSIFA